MFRLPVSLALLALVLAALACASPKAYADQTYCVSTVIGLRNALVAAEVDSGDSYIKVHTGTYKFATGLEYSPDAEFLVPAGSLTVEGGYGADCNSRTDDASLTTIQSIASEPFNIFTRTSSVTLKTMTLDQTYLWFAGGVLADGCTSSSLKFEGRRLRSVGGKIHTSSECHDIVFRDSLFANPADGTALDVYLNEDDDGPAPTLTMVNNTVAEGRLLVYACCDFRGRANLYNNVFRNAGDEILTDAVNVYAVNNRYDNLVFSSDGDLPAGSLLAGSTGNVSSNPDLDATYRPNINSPMVNSGTSTVPGGLLSVDLYGGERVIGSKVDRGALESPVDGSGTYTVTNTNASGPGSLSNVIDLTNADSGYNTIKFNISGGCPRRIVLPSTLYLRDYVLLDGWSQPGSVQNEKSTQWNGKPCVILDGNGTLLTGIGTGPQLSNGIVTIRGLAFEGFTTAILLTYGNGSVIRGNQFGGQIGNSGPVLAGNGNAITLALSAVNTVIGGSEDAHANLIGSSTTTGISVLVGSTGNQIVGNRIGTAKGTTGDLHNQDGIHISTANNSVRDNFISRNTRDGIVLSNANANGNVIGDNRIGGSPGPYGASGNGRMGVLIDDEAHDNTIGPNNTISSNGDSGVRVLSAAGGHNRITENSIDSNDSPGIDLGPNGVTPNDFDSNACPATIGCAANRDQNFPVIQSAVRIASGDLVGLSISARITTTVSSDPYRIDFYRSPDCNASGYGEGRHWIGFKNVVVANEGYCAGNNCTANFSLGTLNDPAVIVGDAISATATSPAGDTSEFAACVLVENFVNDRIFADGFE